MLPFWSGRETVVGLADRRAAGDQGLAGLGNAAEQIDLSYLAASIDDAGSIDHNVSRFSSIEIQKGLMLLASDIKLNAPLTMRGETFPAACLSVILDGNAEGSADVHASGFRRNEVWVSSTNDHHPTTKVVLPNRRVQTVELVVTKEWFEHRNPTSVDDPVFDALRAAMESPTSLKRRSLDARLRQIAWSVLHPPENAAIAALHLESRALDLLIVLLGELSDREGQPNGARLTAGALERIMAVREKIDADPAAITTLATLASSFGMSASKLKQDFFVAFGTCTGAYVNERRLLLGHELIERHGLSVSEAAYRSGYAHPANFTAAFRRRFGYPPSAMKR